MEPWDFLGVLIIKEMVMLKVYLKKLGTVAIVCLQGRIVNGETTALRDAVDSQSNVSAVVLDLGRVSTIDAAGLGVLLELRERTQSRGIDFKLMNITKLVSRVLEITRLNSVFEVTSGAEILLTVSRCMPASLELASCA
jgi:anti-anti-sigma factor